MIDKKMEATVASEVKIKTLAVIGFAPPSRVNAPWDNPDITIAGLNEEYKFDWFKRKEGNVIWFQLHGYESFTRENNTNDPKHWKWLQKKHSFPIYMQEKYDEIPSSVKYPKEKIFAEYGNYFTSTLTYIMAWAVLEDYKRIEIYGFNMASNTEYITQRANTHYFIGLLRGKGIDIYVDPSCLLMRGYAQYAYGDVMLGCRQDLELVRAANREKLTEVLEEVHILRGRANALMDTAHLHEELIDEYKQAETKASKLRDSFYIKKGWLRGLLTAEQMMDKFMGFTRTSGGEDA